MNDGHYIWNLTLIEDQDNSLSTCFSGTSWENLIMLHENGFSVSDTGIYQEIGLDSLKLISNYGGAPIMEYWELRGDTLEIRESGNEPWYYLYTREDGETVN